MKITIEYSEAQLAKCGDAAVLSTFLDMLQAGSIDLSKPTVLSLIDTDVEENDVRWGTLTVAEDEMKVTIHERLAATGENWAEHLDELVHDTKGSEAADINNSGTAGQIEYLLDSGVAVFHILNCLGREDLMGEEPDEHKEGCTYPTVCPKCGCMITDKGFCSDLTCPNSDSGA